MGARAHRLARGAYSAVLTALQPAYLLRLWWRGRAEPLYRHAIGERMGRHPVPASSGWVWVHAVSLGETRAAAALIAALRSAHPALRLLLTHGTATGRAAGASLLQPGDRQAWLPFDTRAATDRFIRHFNPAVGVLMETEIWPNLLTAAHRQRVPMVLANARLSAKSLTKGRRLDALLRPAVRSLAAVLAQTEDDARRLKVAGAARVVVSGNLKFDVNPDPAQLTMGQAWRDTLARDVVLAASTRENEEAPLLAAWLQQPEPRPLLLIVPRHPQRFEAVAALVQASGLSLARRSRWAAVPDEGAREAQVWLGDSMGEMTLYYGMAQVALLGGSFAPLGGQNLIEAAACGCPVVMGPHTYNFADAAELSLAAGAALRVVDMEAGVATALSMLSGPIQRDMGARALQFAAQHRGAAGRMASQILQVMGASARR